MACWGAVLALGSCLAWACRRAREPREARPAPPKRRRRLESDQPVLLVLPVLLWVAKRATEIAAAAREGWGPAIEARHSRTQRVAGRAICMVGGRNKRLFSSIQQASTNSTSSESHLCLRVYTDENPKNVRTLAP